MPREADVICNDIDILDDDIEEQNEFFSVIFSFVNVSAESSLITITISDDDQIGKHMHDCAYYMSHTLRFNRTMHIGSWHICVHR